MTKAEELIQKAKVQLVLHHPFFASIVFKRPITFSDDPEYTASMDLGGNMTFGKAFIEKLPVQQVVFLMAHEAMHYAMMHGMRRKWRKHKQFNSACDKVINDILIESGVGERLAEGVFQAGARDYSAEQLYNEDEGAGDGDGSYTAGRGTNDLSDANAPADASAQQAQEEEIRQELAQAMQAAKTCGKMPLGLERVVGEIINPPTPWHVLLERFMTDFVNAGTTWSRPNKRLLEVGYFPSHSKKPTIGTVGIIGDSSGSIGQKEVAHFVGHMNSIMEKCNPEKVIFLHVDSEVHGVDEYNPDDLPIRLSTIKGGGGTDMGAGIKWFQDEGIDPDVCVVLTDGETPWPDRAPDFPLAVLCTTDKTIPYGELIKYRMED